MGFAMFFFMTMYALIRYDKSMSGSEPHANIPMYIVDKAIAWTALWMMVVLPFAGNSRPILNLPKVVEYWLPPENCKDVHIIYVLI